MIFFNQKNLISLFITCNFALFWLVLTILEIRIEVTFKLSEIRQKLSVPKSTDNSL